MSRTPLTRLTAVTFTILLLAAAGAVPDASAQQFGRNKVQYKDFDFEVVETEHFRIHRYPDEREASDQAARLAERWYARLSRLLDHELQGRQVVLLYASHPDFEQTNAISGLIDESTGGVTESFKRRVILPLAGTLAETDHVLGHELVHAFQYDLARAERMGQASLARLPLWFIEGMAEYLSIGPVDAHTAMWIRDASREERLPDISKLDDPRLFPYRWGHALWAYIGGRFGDDAVAQVFREALRSGSALEAIAAITGRRHEELSRDWHEAIRAQYTAVLESGRDAAAFGRLVSPGSDSERSISVSPSISPDGRRLVYLSGHGLLSIDLFVADAETGAIVRRLTNTAIDPHITSLQFIGSAGSWHPDGRQFVASTIRNGAAELTVFDVEEGGKAREIPLPELGEVLNPSWSPKGDAIVFSAMRGGWSDLYLYDLAGGSLRQLTRDGFADLQPAWSPDGARIAFVTDRFSTRLADLDAGEYQLALIDPATAHVEPLRTFDRGKAINPQWDPGGGRIYFLSDRTGLTDVYAVDLRSREIRQVTGLKTGATGITALSPALSVASASGRLAFSAYEHGHVGIYLADAPQVRAGQAPGTDRDGAAAVLPPRDRRVSAVAAMLDDPATGLPGHPGPAEPYRPGLSLDFVGQPYVTGGMSSFGPTYGGGITFVSSDMLGNHQLVASIDANTYGTGVADLANNIGGVLAYENRGGRWNWGVAAEQTPSIAGGFLSGISSVGGQPVLVEESVIQRQTWRGVSGVAAYPFSRTRRLEFGGSYRHLTFDEHVRTIVTSLATGDTLSDDTTRRELARPLDLTTAGAAAVIDRSVFGATSPVDGERARFEIAPTIGSIDFTTAMLDYRRYVMPARFYTIAGRVLHIGRYGAGGEDSRLLPLFLGYPDLMRGYDIGSFEASECTATLFSDCPEFDRLVGSRLLVGNLELRFPLLRPFGVRSGMYGPIPVEVAFFADGGLAWTRAERPSFAGGDRRGVSSAGVTFRVNLFGYAVAQIDYARPFQRPGRGWVWAFSLTPGY